MSGPTLPSFSTIYAFGDSLSDAGNLSIATEATGQTPVSPPYFHETYGFVTANVFSNGPTWVQDLSLSLGLGTLEPSLLSGGDFAYGGAETGATPQDAGETSLALISLPAQLAQFQLDNPNPLANALYTISIGSNDLLDILAGNVSASQQTIDVTDAVDNELSFLGSLASDGAKNLLVLGIPDLGDTPEVLDGLSGGSPSLASALAREYNSDLAAGLASIASAGTNVTVIDAYGLIDNAVANPSVYGLNPADVSTPVWSGSYSVASSGSLAATGAAQDQYLFFDHLHPTERAEQAVAALALADLEGQPAPCFVAGTRIATERGNIAVEQLQVGDLVRLAEGGTAPVAWLGHRRVDCRRHPRPHEVQPVRVAAHAFGMGRPQRDLLLSPDHAVFCDGVLIPVRYLLNDATIRQEDVAAVAYWHVELPAHGVMLAEGLPAESYLDAGSRAGFANGGPVVTAHPRFARAVWDADGCAPLVTEGPARDAVYRRLTVQAALVGSGATAHARSSTGASAR